MVGGTSALVSSGCFGAFSGQLRAHTPLCCAAHFLIGQVTFAEPNSQPETTAGAFLSARQRLEPFGAAGPTRVPVRGCLGRCPHARVHVGEGQTPEKTHLCPTDASVSKSDSLIGSAGLKGQGQG